MKCITFETDTGKNEKSNYQKTPKSVTYSMKINFRSASLLTCIHMSWLWKGQAKFQLIQNYFYLKNNNLMERSDLLLE